jgi:S1-C subfamily serine protease
VQFPQLLPVAASNRQLLWFSCIMIMQNLPVAAVACFSYVAMLCYLYVTFLVILSRRPDYFLPWQNHPKRESTGTGFVIRDRLILTNAHVVADQTYVTVKRHGSGTKYRAGRGCGLH